MSAMPGQILKESCENNQRLVLILKSQVFSPEEVIKNLAFLPDANALAPCLAGPGILSLAQSCCYPVFSILSKSLHYTFHPSPFPPVSRPEMKPVLLVFLSSIR
jgi:hypothetical protein